MTVLTKVGLREFKLEPAPLPWLCGIGPQPPRSRTWPDGKTPVAPFEHFRASPARREVPRPAARAHVAVLHAALAQPIEAFRDGLPRRTGRRFRPGIDLTQYSHAGSMRGGQGGLV